MYSGKIQTSVNAYGIDKDLPFFKNMERYISVKISCLYDYHIDHDFPKFARECSQYLTEWQGERIVERATQRDPEAILDMALRYLSGCGTLRRSPDGALYVLDSFTDRNCDPARYVGHVAPRTIMAQAHSCAAHAYFDKFMATPAELVDFAVDGRRFGRPQDLQSGLGQSPLASFSQAVHHANESVKLGLVSPIVLRVGLMMRDLGAQLGVDVSQMGRSRRFRPLWRAVTHRMEELYAEERKKQARVGRKPNAYMCAAEGCGIRADGRAALKACSGKCPPDLKPHYCSKECQKKDWPRHKPICKAGTPGKMPLMLDSDKANALKLFELGESEEGECDEVGAEGPRIAQLVQENNAGDNAGDKPMRYTQPGAARTITIPAPNAPGGSIHITSNTLDPESMKAFRAAASTVLGKEVAS
ncbi:hypothetical protein BV20DRAFT_830292 [Pilatotrama ljubarskyi]|nr:hypothetical protein BV20DRAFT_830292 [Pilatotrama ljubarskyi]